VSEPQPWITRSTRTAYSNPWLRITEHDVELPNGASTFYGVVRCRPCVGVVPFVDDDHVLMVRQWRYIIERSTWEIPTGGCHDGEPLVAAAQRELIEETGHRAARFTTLGAFNTSKSVVDETAHLFLAHDLAPDTSHPPDETELISLEVVTFDQVLTWVLDGEIVDAMSIIAVLHADRLRRASDVRRSSSQ
jgi:ADP-ribose pyrophosphatase